MKKIFSILFILAMTFSIVNAQTYTMTGSGDTITNTGTKACSLKVVHSYKQVTVHALVTKISGTVAGTLTLQGTVDGVTFVTVDSCVIQNENNTPASFTATNVASQSKVWVVNGSPYLWFKVSYTGSGTMAATLKGYLLPRKSED